MLESVFSFFSESVLWLLFSTGALSATLLPGSSEVTLITALDSGQHPVTLLICMAALGNTLGGMINYLIGLWLPNRTQKKKYGHKALVWLNKHGYFALFFSWLPLVGDPLCLAAGWLRMRCLPCFLCIALGKTARYCLLAALFYNTL
ncbi:hypothetical protein CSW98_13100 [Vibrio sp. HA2012]|uniref:YqaA family protein n=1 Tax=Vibrio sp. HA2012 TaxID=1971595 RepID=UPI000C2C4451|nr:YqaA family protein [Vibrio sp. HA2012]PJC85966.1 hypothetical protein CSW98_13100 [Vibrio sp. HA2012]